MGDAVVRQSIDIVSTPELVWSVLLDREKGRIWRNADFETDWEQGSPISMTTQIGTKRYKDQGVLDCTKPMLLADQFLPRMSGLPYTPANYSRVTFRLSTSKVGTTLSVEHSVPPSPVRKGKNFETGSDLGEKHVIFYWRSTMPLLRDMVEGRPSIALQMAVAASR
jgi:hypothetical protein